MSKLPRISSRECIRALERAGFEFIDQTGSHIKMRRETPFAQVIVPQTRELAPGTLRSIIRQTGLTVTQFEDLL